MKIEKVLNNINFFKRDRKLVLLQLIMGILLLIAAFLYQKYIIGYNINSFIYDLLLTFGTTLLIVCVTLHYNRISRERFIKNKLDPMVDRLVNNLPYIENFIKANGFILKEDYKEVDKATIIFPKKFPFVTNGKEKKGIRYIQDIHTFNFNQNFEEVKSYVDEVDSEEYKVLVECLEFGSKVLMKAKINSNETYTFTFENNKKFLDSYTIIKQKFNLKEVDYFQIEWESEAYYETESFLSEARDWAKKMNFGNYQINEPKEFLCSTDNNLKSEIDLKEPHINYHSNYIKYSDFVNVKLNIGK